MSALQFHLVDTIIGLLSGRLDGQIHGEIGQSAAWLWLAAALFFKPAQLLQQLLVALQAGQIERRLLGLRFDL